MLSDKLRAYAMVLEAHAKDLIKAPRTIEMVARLLDDAAQDLAALEKASIATESSPRASRDVPPGKPWIFPGHRTVVEVIKAEWPRPQSGDKPS